MNLYAGTAIGAFVICTILSLLVLLSGKRDPKRNAFVPVTLLIGTWCFFPTIPIWINNPDNFLFLVKIIYIAALFTCPAFLNFGLAMAEVSTQKFEKSLVKLSYIAAFLFLPILFSPFMITSAERHPPYFILVPGQLFPLYALFFITTCTYSFYRLFKVFLTSTGYRRNQIKYVLIAFLIAFASGFMHLGSFYGLREVFPHDFLVIICMLILFYAIAQYRLMDVNVAIAKAVSFSVVYTIVLGIPFVIAYKIDGSKISYIPIIVAIILASGGPFLYSILTTRVLKRVIKKRLQYQKTLLQASKGMALIKEVDKLLKLIVHVMGRAVGVTHINIYLRKKEADEYEIKAMRHAGEKNPSIAEVSGVNPLVKWIMKHKTIVVYEEIQGIPEEREAAKQMKTLGAEILIPSFIQDNLIGFMIMGKKRSGDMYTEDDIGIFQIVANQAGLAIENAMFFEETGKDLTQQFHEHRLRSIGKMGSYMGHQINNRFQAILVKAEELTYFSLKKLKNAKFTDDERKALEKAYMGAQAVADNATRGGEIVRQLSAFSRRETKTEPVDPDELIKSALFLLECKFDLNEINLQVEIEKTDYKIKGDSIQLQDILFNLLDNAHDAEQQKQKEIPDYVPSTKISAYIRNNRWEIIVEDNGSGLSQEHLDHLFLPFFTTKATTKKGTGIGLAVVRMMIEAHKGTISAKSEEGKGTKFIIVLPAMKETEDVK